MFETVGFVLRFPFALLRYAFLYLVKVPLMYAFFGLISLIVTPLLPIIFVFTALSNDKKAWKSWLDWSFFSDLWTSKKSGIPEMKREIDDWLNGKPNRWD
ncbi:hypothetical protein [Sulfitobacter sp. M368]|uniref:hypothetical protein n=1 Tax=Sulfitobacter sp. M368 TaxID=2867021 RepID=UPI0021A5309C|nr:hypothetical protein [Sulfitobacter sp. M368]UWR13613.1 hypothetical protein K3754_09645 [Sulfitobacter sp. M368]